MTADRWRRVEEVYHAALGFDSGDRPAFLRDACRDDSDLRCEVESLLAQREPGHILDQTLGAVAADVLPNAERRAPGNMAGPYRIVGRLGMGGMGEVYRAVDTRLGREVALKFLPAEQLADPEQRRLFFTEARTAAALSHQNIVTFFDLLSDGAEDVLVLECVPGKTLDQLIGKPGLPLRDTLAYAIQIADGLAVAHQAGVVHRDVKPANVIVKDNGTLKILDFGLAKFADVGTDQDPTQTLGTGDGRIVGTVAYMSPEQAEGRKVDARSDIFSFGVVLYEMLTGRKAFLRDTTKSTLGAIVRDEFEPLPDIPKSLRTLLARCLRKDPSQRAQSMADIKIALEEILAEHAGPVIGPLAKNWKTYQTVLPAILALVAVAFWMMRGTRSAPAATQVVPLTTYAGSQDYPSFSPDGNQVAFEWNGHINVKLIGSDPLRLTTNPGVYTTPAWSPDGRSIAFLRLGQNKAEILVARASGGPERQVAEVHPTTRISPSWSPDGRYLIISAPRPGVRTKIVWVVSLEGGEKRQITFPPRGIEGDDSPVISPDGRTLVYVRNRADLYVLPLESDFRPKGEPRLLTSGDLGLGNLAAWTSDSREVIYSCSSFGLRGLWRIAVTGRRAEPRRLPVGEYANSLAVSWHGNRLVYNRRSSDSNIWRVNLMDPAEKPVQLIASTRQEIQPRYSPDGRKIAFLSDRSGQNEIWICNADGSSPLQLTSMGVYGTPGWSPDGERIAFASVVGDFKGIFIMSIHGGPAHRLTSVPAINYYDTAPIWSSDGRWIYFTSNRNVHLNIWRVPVAGGAPSQITQNVGIQSELSPDGKTLYYTRGGTTVWSAPADGGEEIRALESVDSRNFAVARKGIYFFWERKLQFFDFNTHESIELLTVPHPVARGLDSGLGMSPDEHWLLYSQIDHATSGLMLVENFR